jgi:MFS transporter, putative metabolite:H+ symporter
MAIETTSDDAGAILARLDRIPIWPYPRSVLCIIGFGFFFAFFDIVTIGFAVPVVSKQFDVSPEFASWTITGSLLGYIAGSFLDSRFADRFGRRMALMISVSFFTVGSLMSAASPGIWWLISWRFISGMGIGAEIAAVSAYLGELSPAPTRGRNTAWAIAAGMLGFALVPFIALALVPHYDWGWRALFIIGALGGVVIGVMRRGLPHSAHWLLNRNCIAEADAVVKGAERLAEKRLGRELPPPGASVVEPPIGHGAFRDLFEPAHLKRLTLIATIWFVYYIGNYAWLTLAPTLFIKIGYSLGHSIAFMVLTGVGFVVGASIAALISDRSERKVIVAVTCVVWALALFVIGLKPSDFVIMFCGFIASTTIGLLIPILYTYTAENFPTGIRATGVAATDGIGHLGGALAPIVVLAVYRQWDFAAAFYVMAATGLLAAVLLAFGVRTTGKPLAEIP